MTLVNKLTGIEPIETQVTPSSPKKAGELVANDAKLLDMSKVSSDDAESVISDNANDFQPSSNLFTGERDGKYYQDGILLTGLSAAGKYYKNGKLATGTFDGLYYKNGEAFTGTYNGYKYVDGVKKSKVTTTTNSSSSSTDKYAEQRSSYQSELNYWHEQANKAHWAKDKNGEKYAKGMIAYYQAGIKNLDMSRATGKQPK